MPDIQPQKSAGKAISTYTRSTFKDSLSRNKIVVSIFFVFLILWLAYLAGNFKVFSSFQIYKALLSTIPFIGIMALAATFIVTLGDMDLSFPSTMALSAWIFCTLVSIGVNVWFAALVCILAGALCGLFNSVLIVRIGMPSLVITIATQYLFRGTVNVLANGRGISISVLSGSVFANLAVYRLFNLVPMQAVWFLLATILFWLLMNRHWYGTHISFIGDNKASARMMGINVNTVRSTAFVVMGIAAAFTGILSNIEVQYFWPSQGDSLLMPVLAAIFIGGTSVTGGKGSIMGTFMGVFIIGSLEAGIVAIGLTGFWVQFIYGFIIIAAVTLYTLISGSRRID
jgi:simple sugar transport system permease protein